MIVNLDCYYKLSKVINFMKPANKCLLARKIYYLISAKVRIPIMNTQELVYYACNHANYASTNQDDTDIKQGNHITPSFSFRTYQQSVQ